MSLVASAGEPPTLPTTVPPGEEPLVDVGPRSPRFLVDLKYATADNFVGKVIYAEARCLLRAGVAERMVKAQAWLDREHPGHRLMFKDCYRPDAAQRVLWAAVVGTPMAEYVANPFGKNGSMHSYGAAVDLTLADDAGRELDMGTPYDFLGPLAEPQKEARFLAEKKLSPRHVENRAKLRGAMAAGGMRGLPHEWWHFDAGTAAEVRARYSRLDVPFSAVPKR